MKKILISISIILSLVSCEELDVNIDQTTSTDFEFEILFDQKENYINEKTPFQIKLKSEGEEELSYLAYFRNMQGEVIIDGQETTFIQNRSFQIEEGITEGTFMGRAEESGDLEFVIEASNGIIKSETIKFTTKLTNFEVIITPEPLSGNYRSDLFFTYQIRRPGNLEQNIEYFLFITVSGFEDLQYRIQGMDEVVFPGVEASIGNELLNLCYLTQVGYNFPQSGTVTFHYRDSNGAVYEKTIDVDLY